MYYEGFYHLFYQYNPWGAVWGNLTWGHAVSKDLIHWLDLELALERDQWYDAGGVWSGSVSFRPDGSPIILYTGKFIVDPNPVLLFRSEKYCALRFIVYSLMMWTNRLGKGP